MYSVRPLGINIKDNDWDVPDGSLQESINMQWRDGSFKPIPERIISDIDASWYKSIIFHKVGDENQINVIGFYQGGTAKYLAFDIADYLAGTVNGNNKLFWFGTILNGVYTPKETPFGIDVTRTTGMSFTILNGLIYFMGDGSSELEQYYLKVEFDEATSTYKVYDMYKWKSLIPFFPFQTDITLLAPKNTKQAFSQCGIVLIRFAIVLKSGEVVLHSPIYGYLLYGINRSTEALKKGDIIENIHAFVNLNLSFLDATLFDEEVSAINVYASTPDYESKFLQDYSDEYSIAYLIKQTDIKGKLAKKAEEPFYLVKTINAPTTTEKLLLTVGSFDSDIALPENTAYTYSRVDIATVAAGEIMPVDNFTYHKIYGKITSYNGRLVVKRPTTVLSGGHIRALARVGLNSDQAFSMITEDGTLSGISYAIDKAIEFSTTGIYTRGILSYPDVRANLVGANDSTGENIRLFKCRKNTAHNLSCNFEIFSAAEKYISFVVDPDDSSKLRSITDYCIYIVYDNSVNTTGGEQVFYNVPPEQVDGRLIFEVPDKINLTLPTYARIPHETIYEQDTDYTVDNDGTGGKGRFIFNVAPVGELDLWYYSTIELIDNPEIPVATPSVTDANVKYTSENRIQFSQSGEFKVWPAINSYRIGEGKVMNLGLGSVNPSDSFVISPIIVGTSDGIYTINLDPTGNNFISSITKTANIPFLSEEILEIDNNILFVSDQGLMVFSNGDFQNLTKDYFPQQGNGNFKLQESIYTNYNVLTSSFFGSNGNPYKFEDVVTYLKGALMAYDSRRGNIWLCNPDYTFSLVYNSDTKQWGMSTLVFAEKQELFSVIETETEEIYSRYTIKAKSNSNLLILSGEDLSKEVFYHILTRPIKFGAPDEYNILTRMFVRTLLARSTTNGYFALGLWGQQDVNMYKKSIPITAKKDNRVDVYPGNIRQHLPIGCRKGKYKSVTVLQAGKTLPESYISSFDFDVFKVDNQKMR